MKYFIGLGSNLGDRERNLEVAISSLEEFCSVLNKSSVYETKPVGYLDQGDFLNMVVEVESALEPLVFFIRLQEVEHKMGRVREVKNGPRVIDLDILLAEDLVINTPHLKIPHPRMHERGFVLEPLCEIAPDVVHPVLGELNDIRNSDTSYALCKKLKN